MIHMQVAVVARSDRLACNTADAEKGSDVKNVIISQGGSVTCYWHALPCNCSEHSSFLPM